MLILCIGLASSQAAHSPRWLSTQHLFNEALPRGFRMWCCFPSHASRAQLSFPFISSSALCTPKHFSNLSQFSACALSIGKSQRSPVSSPPFLQHVRTCVIQCQYILSTNHVLLFPMFAFSFPLWPLLTNSWSPVHHWMASSATSSRAPSLARFSSLCFNSITRVVTLLHLSHQLFSARFSSMSILGFAHVAC